MTIDINAAGTVYAQSQVTDYCTRGDRLDEYNIISFFTDTYERRKSSNEQAEDESAQDLPFSTPHRGRPRNEWVSYHREHPRSQTVYRVIRSKNHNNLPNFVGQKFPQSNDPETHSFYCASMLMLLKPW